MIITFVGHSSILGVEDLTVKIINEIEKNVRLNEKTTFYCGGYGDFDNITLRCCHLLKNKRKNIEIIYITPYLTQREQKKINILINEGVYDSVVYPPIESVPPRLAILKRNEWMVDKADIIIAYVKYSYGGAYRRFKYAKKRDKKIINLADF